MAGVTRGAEIAVVIDLSAHLRARRQAGAVDDAVLDAARSGDPHAWFQIYRWLAGPVRGYLAGRGGADLDDLLGEVFVQLSRNIHSFDGDVAQFRSWAFLVAHNRVIDQRRRQRRDRCEVRPSEDLAAPGPAAGDCGAPPPKSAPRSPTSSPATDGT